MCAVAVADLIYNTDLGLTNNVVPLVSPPIGTFHAGLTLCSQLSVVVGLLLVFRNSTAYARWQEGRQLFSNMSNNVRNLARLTWVAVGQLLKPQTDRITDTNTTNNLQ